MGEVYERLRAAVGEWGAAHGYRASADPFSFDSEPHGEQAAVYVDPPRLEVAGYVGAGALVTGRCAIWLSVAAGTDAAGAADRLAGDLRALAVALIAADLGDDTNVHQAYGIDVAPRADRAVTVVGVLRLTADWDQDA